MARWVWPAAAGVVTSATGVAINLATDGGANPWAWVVVVLLTALGVVIAVLVPRPAPKPEVEQPAQPPAVESKAAESKAPRSSVQNVIRGDVAGPVLQVGDVGSISVNSPTTVNQTAVAREGSTIYQAGRDVKHNP